MEWTEFVAWVLLAYIACGMLAAAVGVVVVMTVKVVANRKRLWQRCQKWLRPYVVAQSESQSPVVVKPPIPEEDLDCSVVQN
jgi:hypothetical protein